MPEFRGHDSAIIVDSEKIVAQKKYNDRQFPIKMRVPFPLWRQYPRYHFMPRPPPRQVLTAYHWANIAKDTGPFTHSVASFPMKSDTTTTKAPTPKTVSISTLSPIFRGDDFPAELLAIAQNELGLRNTDEIPSISEWGQLVGTKSPEETLKYIKRLALNERGIALLKAYIESADYTDKTGELVKNKEDSQNKPVDEEDNDAMFDTVKPLRANDADLNGSKINNDEELTQTNTTPKMQEFLASNHSLIGRLSNFVHITSLFNSAEQQTRNKGKKLSKKENPQLKDIHQNLQVNPDVNSKSLKTPLLVRESVPFNYPIPIRIQSFAGASDVSAKHLNTPKVLIPHVHHISRVTNVPVRQIEDIVASKPKLLDLITKVGRFPITYHRSSPVEAQVIAAVRKAFEEDEDLKRILSSTSTLK